LGLFPQRDNILRNGSPTRTSVVIEQEEFSHLAARVKSLGFSMTHLLDAATILAVFEVNSEAGQLTSGSHVTFDPASISLSRYMAPSLKTRFVSAVANVALSIEYKDIVEVKEPHSLLVHCMSLLKEQYDSWLSSPHFPSLSSVNLPPVFPSPYAVYITNIGVVESHIPLNLGTNKDTPVITIEDMAVGHRLVTPRPTMHAWSIHNELHLQIQACDMWDASYLGEFLKRIVTVIKRSM